MKCLSPCFQCGVYTLLSCMVWIAFAKPFPSESLPVNISVEFGDPRLGCKGSGFCAIRPDPDGRLNDRLVTGRGRGTARASSGNLEICILKRSLDHRTRKQYFADTIFQVPAPLDLPRVLLSEMGMERSSIRPGDYRVIESCDAYTMRFENQ